jgi:hypothetical protein
MAHNGASHQAILVHHNVYARVKLDWLFSLDSGSRLRDVQGAAVQESRLPLVIPPRNRNLTIHFSSGMRPSLFEVRHKYISLLNSDANGTPQTLSVIVCHCLFAFYGKEVLMRY